MKPDLERLLSDAPLRAPSRHLAERIDAAFQQTRSCRVPWYRSRVPLWAAIAAAFACGSLGYAVRRTPPPQTVYVLPAEGELRRVLLGEAGQRPEDPLAGLQIQVVALPNEES